MPETLGVWGAWGWVPEKAQAYQSIGEHIQNPRSLNDLLKDQSVPDGPRGPWRKANQLLF